jgi:predicted SnoaL-like aldol condensation-catalyzing enzyme
VDDRLEQNKQNAKAFYDLMFNRSRPAEAIERYVGDEYIQHNVLQIIPPSSANDNTMF